MSNEHPVSFAGVPIVLSGPSGVGKTTVRKQLLSRYQDIAVSISATTRPAREGEVSGKDYLFFSKPDFEKGIDEGRFLEWAEVHGEYYGTPKGPVEDHLRSGIDVLLVIDIQGGVNVKKSLPESLLLFLLPPTMEELSKRLSQRGSDSEEAIALRMKNAREEVAFARYYDYWVVNHSLEEAVATVRSIIVADRYRASRSLDRYRLLGYHWPDLESD